MNFKQIQVWDFPTRLFHWLVVLLIPALWFSAEQEMLDLHMLLAYSMLTLWVFRLLWWFMGSRYSLLSSLKLAPAKVISYIKNNLNSDYPGHNPLGSWSIIIMMLLLGAQLFTGLSATDDVMYEGPLAILFSDDTVKLLTRFHHKIFNILIIMIGLHICAIIFYRIIKKQHLVKSMFSGNKEVVEGKDNGSTPWGNFIVAIIAAIIIAWALSQSLFLI